MVYTFIDIETTGLIKFDANNVLIPDLLEFSYLIVDTKDWAIIKYGNLYFYQDHFDIESEPAHSLHGLERNFLKQYEDKFEENLMALESIVMKANIVGKNSDAFDLKFIYYFLQKYHGDDGFLERIVEKADQKAYDGKRTVGYYWGTNSFDMQPLYAPIWRVKYVMQNMGCLDEFYNNMTQETFNKYAQYAVGIKKKGKLSEYIDLIPDGYKTADYIYDHLEDQRGHRLHSGIYDCILTYITCIEYLKFRRFLG